MHDLIIVGAGTAGCVLAERLTASGTLRVLLIEAGGKPSSSFVSMPAGFAQLFKSKFDWAFESEPQSAKKGKRIFTPRGKMLGGSSNLNAQIHQWCHPADFDGWEQAGATGWGWADVAPVFHSQENWTGEQGEYARGRQGPMCIAPNANAHPLSRAFVASAHSIGLNGQKDYNGGHYQGAWVCQLAHRKGKRFSAYNAYLEPAMRRSNLEVLTDAHVMRIGFKQGRATSVTVKIDGTERTYQAGKGIVLSSGAIGTPHLLMHSGIGPAAELRRLGIPVQVDAPEVGENLQDHPALPLVIPTSGTDTMKNATSLFSLAKYLLLKRGMLASNGIEAFVFTHSNGKTDAAPDIELLCAPFEWRCEGLEPPGKHAFCIACIVVAPHSRGRLTLKNADPFTPPAIDFNLLNDPQGKDVAIMLAAIKLAQKITSTAPLSQLLDPPSTAEMARKTDQDLLNQSAEELQTVYHPSSTCRMGSDSRSVVDPQLRVRGVENLWAVDASVMPSVPRGHPNAVVAMIAQRAAEFIQ